MVNNFKHFISIRLQIVRFGQHVKVSENIFMFPNYTKVIVAVSEVPRKFDAMEDEMIFIPQHMATSTQPVLTQNSGPT